MCASFDGSRFDVRRSDPTGLRTSAATRPATDEDALRFPVELARELPRSTDDLFTAFDVMSRRINDLARELHCLGHFDTDDDDDRPRAA